MAVTPVAVVGNMTRTKFFQIVTPLFLSSVFTVVVFLLIKEHIQYPGVFDDVGAWSAFFSVFGIVYAIVAGFLLVTVLTKYSDLGLALENELNAIETVRDFLIYLGEKNARASENIVGALHFYSVSLLQKEWPDMSDPNDPMDSDTSEELYEIMRKSKEISVESDSDATVFSAIIENISDITKLRTRRIALANDTLPPRLKLLMVFMGLKLAGTIISILVF